MGYNTDFAGSFEIKPEPLEENLTEFLKNLGSTRRMKRTLSPNYGIDGEFYVYGKGNFGQDKEENIVDYNEPPSTQPGLWCDWVPVINYDGPPKAISIAWNGSEKTYNYIKWIQYIVENFLLPFDYWLEGEVVWQGEEIFDRGLIKIEKENLLISRKYDSTKIRLNPRTFFKENCYDTIAKSNFK